MAKNPTRGRFAPSPTGDLHLGSARTALAAYLSTRIGGGAFVLRVEDIDGPRVVPGAAARILADLQRLGIDWDEGPDVGGPYGPYDQSARDADYERAIGVLRAASRIYPCFCSRADIARATAASPSAPHGPADEGPRYPGTCRDLSLREVAAQLHAGRRPSLRFRVDDSEVEFVDGVHGPKRYDLADGVGDFVVRRADGLWAYQLAVVVDDACMEMSEVVRGDDLLSSTPRQLLLYAALGQAPPRFAHVPLLLGTDGQRLSKRHGAVAVRELLDAGIAPESLVGRLYETLVGAPEGSVGRATPRELVSDFALHKIVRAPALIDPATFLPAATSAATGAPRGPRAE